MIANKYERFLKLAIFKVWYQYFCLFLDLILAVYLDITKISKDFLKLNEITLENMPRKLTQEQLQTVFKGGALHWKHIHSHTCEWILVCKLESFVIV